MEKIAFFGKGGIGKSTIASNVTAALALKGRKVLHVGCDPKMDSTLLLMGRRIPSFAAAGGYGSEESLRASIHAAPLAGVHCIEAGGPEPGLGCAGAGIGQMFDVMKSVSLLDEGGYDSVIYDVLGDVVCGGFAAPLRLNFAAKTVIVTSETAYSLYAANRLIGMVANFSRNGARLAGIVANIRTPAGEDTVRRFAGLTGARLLGTLLQDPAVSKAERQRRPAVEAFPDCDFSRRIAGLCRAISGPCPPRPARQLTEEDFFSFVEGKPFRGAIAAPTAAAAAPRSAVEVLGAAGFKPLGMEQGQVVCEWASPSGGRKVLIAHSSSPHEGAFRLADWKIFFHPSGGVPGEAEAWALREAAAGLERLSFGEMLPVVSAGTGFYEGITRLCGPRDRNLRHKADIGFGDGPFILTTPDMPFIPPGAAMAEYSDSECRFAVCEGGRLGLTHESEEENQRPGPSLGPVPPLPDSRMRIAEMNLRDAVMGGEEKALAVLRGAADRTGPGGLVIFYTGCSQITLAFDPSAAIRKIEKEKRVRVIFADSGTLTALRSEKAFIDYMAGRMKRARVGKRAGANLIGFAGDREPLARLLTERGIAITGRAPFYKMASSAALNILSDEALPFAPALDRAGAKWLHAPSPYGFGATRKWLTAVAGAMGAPKTAVSPSDSQKAEAAELRRRAGRYAGGLAAWHDNAAALESWRARTAATLLTEGGFGARLFLFTGGKTPSLGERAEAAARFGGMSGTAGERSVRFLRSPADMPAALKRDRRLRVIYSDVRNDPRVTAAGLTPFSAGIFLPGYDGALETWRRLLELCEWDFNEKYRS